MSILQKLEDQRNAGTELIITPQEYQDLCIEVFELGLPEAAEWDDLILNYLYKGKDVIVKELE